MAKKNPNGTGSRPRKRPDGRYEARYWIDTPDGRKRRSVYGATSKECADKLADVKKNANEPPAFVPTNITIAEFFEQYEDAVRATMKQTREILVLQRSFASQLDCKCRCDSQD